MRLQNYDVHIVYQPGPQQLIADQLSRSPQFYTDTGSQTKDEPVVSLILLEQDWTARIKEATAKDEGLFQLSKTIAQGWPEQKSAAPEQIRPYYDFRYELGLQNETVYRGERIVIPAALRQEMIKQLHSAHLGQQATLRQARESMFWPRMSSEITEHVARCDTCQALNTGQQKETLLPVEKLDRPWQMIACDLFTWRGQDYLVTVDCFSNFVEVDKLAEAIPSTVIRKLKKLLSHYGMVETLISDNGPQLCSAEFGKFAREWNFEHRTSSPHHQQANGRAEAAVKVVKRLMEKAKVSGKDPNRALLAYCNTPQESMDTSPTQRFFGRRGKTDLPTTRTLLQPKGEWLCRSHKEDLKTSRMKAAYDKGAKDLDPLEEGESVRLRPTSMGSKV